MPEGDSIRRIANAIGPHLTGKQLERVTTQGLVRDLAGRTVVSVDAHGKHLVIELDDGTYLRAHLGMNGRFYRHARAEGEARLARMSPGRVSLAVVTAEAIYLWINAPQIEISHRRAPRHGMAVAALGPDVLADNFDSRLVASRAESGTRTISDLLLDQRVVAGIGNIWKCESLFQCGVDPRTPAADVPAETIEALYATAHRLMRDSVAGRRTPSEPARDDRYAVYSRGGQPCRTCGTPIGCEAIGQPPRWTWWCPRCQPAHGSVVGVSR